jgi:hypothetical protein
MTIFITLVGQFYNIGDILHRRVLLNWLKNKNYDVHVYVGNAPTSFIQSLKFDDDVVVYKNSYSFLYKIVLTFFKKKIFLFNPGEFRIGLKRLSIEFFILPFLLLFKLFNGKVIRVGIGSNKNYIRNNIYIYMYKFLLNFSDKVYFRTNNDIIFNKKGFVIPDLAFYDYRLNSIKNSSIKSFLVISLRIDTELPNDNWFNAINKFANDYNLKIIIISQVKADNPMTLNLANIFQAKFFIWSEEISHMEQESILNNIYLNTSIVISDRLHVLILAMISGAKPINLTANITKKIDRHFSVINIEKISFNIQNLSEQQIYKILLNLYSDNIDYNFLLNKSKLRLDNLKNNLIDFINE